MADPNIWCHLPFVLLPLIIENTADPETLRQWCTATKQAESTLLHRVALRETYRKFTVNKKGFLSAFNSCCHRGVSPDSCGGESYAGQSLVSHSYKSLNSSRRNVQNYREISQYIKTLVLDFYFTGVEYRDGLVAIEDVQLTLETLLLHTSVEEIEHDGNMYSLWLDQIVKLSSLRVLKIRDTPCTVPCTWDGDALRGTGWHTKLKWDGLCQMRSLRALYVSQLLVSEASDLAHAIRLLAGLEELYVGASNTQKEDDTLPLFVESFLEANNVASPRSSLKRLSLVDIKHS